MACEALLGGVLALCLTVQAASAQSLFRTWGPSTHMGEPGGEAPTTLTCPDWQHAIGIQVRSGWYIHGIRLECAGIQGGHHREPVLVGGNIGGTTGGTTRMLRCLDGEVLVGFRGNEGWWIDRIQIACKKYVGPVSSSVGRLEGYYTEGPVQWRGTAGGTGGEAYGPVVCPGTYAAYSLTGARVTNIAHGELVIWYAFSCRGRP